MKFFLAGIPLGCNNIGDEAILDGVVKILRRNFETCEITVATDKPQETAKLLNVNAVALIGFSHAASLTEESYKAAEAALKASDVFIWAGATGLSDYPDTAVDLLKKAQGFGLKTIIWGVGMDSTLNPAFFKLGGKKLQICKLIKKLSLGIFDAVKFFQDKKEAKVRAKIASALSKTELIIVRDPETKAELMKCDSSLPVNVGADSAIILNTQNPADLDFLDVQTKEALFGNYEKIGLCISAQRELTNSEELVKTIDALLEGENRRMFFIPMNPLTDSIVMNKLHSKMKNAKKAFMLENCLEPKHVLAAAAQCNVVISSRLHLLILSANIGTRIIGISRGSKVDNFIGQFGIKSVGDVFNCNFAAMKEQAENAIFKKDDWTNTREFVYKNLNNRLSNAESLITHTLKN